jgi:hydrophobe/amphiphile efflux-1 (HAE1) family protein
MLMAGLLILGWTSYRRLPVDLFPDVSFPVMTVTVPYPGASPADIESLVLKPLEDALSSLNGIDRVQSTAREGVGQLLLLYKLDSDTQNAAEDLRERMARVRNLLPREIYEPTVQRLDVSASPVLTYTLSGTSLAEAHAYALDVVAPSLEQVSGVASIQVNGGARREIQVELDRSRLDALRLSPQAVVSRLRAENTNLPAGRVEEHARDISVRLLAEFQGIDQIRETIIATGSEGSAVRLRDVASVIDGFEERRTVVRVNGREAVTFDVRKQSGTNTVNLARAVRARMDELMRELPPGVSASLIVDQSKLIEQQASAVEEDLVFGACIAVIAVLIFMLDLRSTIIGSLALPTSVIGTFFIIYVLGYSLNAMTLVALSLSIGLLIDDAVVVRENIWKHLEQGKSPRQAALDGTAEVSLSVIATTLSVIAVFLPIAFMDGVMGKFLHQFGVTVSVAVALSLFVAFTLDPMLSSRFSRKRAGRERFAALKRPFQWMHRQIEHNYRVWLYFSIQHKAIVALLTLGCLLSAIYTARLIPQDFMNAEDRGQFIVEAELPAGTTLNETARVSRAVERELLSHSVFRTLVANISDEQANVVKWLVLTTDKHERTQSLAELKELAHRAVTKRMAAKVTLLEPPPFEGAATEAQVVVRVSGQDYAKLTVTAERVQEILRATPGLFDVQTRYSPGRAEIGIDLDRQSAAQYGISASEVAVALRTAVAGEEAGTLRQPRQHNDVAIRVRLEKRYRADADSLAAITLQTPKGRIPLSHIATLRRADGPQVIERQNKQRQLTIWATPKGRGLGDAAKDFRPRIAQLSLPADVRVSYDGALRLMDENQHGVGVALLLGVAFIYLVLASQFESFVHPLTIMLSVPFAMFGAILALFLTGSTLALSGLIGMVLLIGLVTKNAILLIDRAIVSMRDHGASPVNAILAAGPERLRPILMTSAAMIFGMLPTALSNGVGSETRAPMAIALVGGVISSTVLSLIVVPVVFLTIEAAKTSLQQRWSWWRNEERSTSAERA